MDKNEDNIRQELRAEYEANMQEELVAYRKALDEEYGSLGELDPDDPDTTSKVRAKVLQLIPDAHSTMKHLLNHADSEQVRAGLAKFVFVEAIGKAKTEGEEQELRDMLKGLTRNSE